MSEMINESKEAKKAVENDEIKPCADMSPIMLNKKYGTVIFLVRHGQSIGNAKGEFLGHTDKDLSALGYIQAKRTGDLLADERIDVIYSSDLIRAKNTAVPHAELRGMDIITSENFREIYAGIWEGMKLEDILKDYGDEFINGWRANFGNYTIPGGESVKDAGNRFFRAVIDVAKENVGKHVLITAHAAVIRSFWGIITNTSQDDLAVAYQYPDNASVSVLYFDGEKLIPGEYSHSAHLADIQK